jgi:hypothetical protein
MSESGFRGLENHEAGAFINHQFNVVVEDSVSFRGANRGVCDNPIDSAGVISLRNHQQNYREWDY